MYIDSNIMIRYIFQKTDLKKLQIVNYIKLNNDTKNDLNFLSFYFNSKVCQDHKSSMSRGEIIVHIYEKQLRELTICIPPKNTV